MLCASAAPKFNRIRETMKIKLILLFAGSLLCASLRAQDLRGVVRDADNQPLPGASVYWAGTTAVSYTHLTLPTI